MAPTSPSLAFSIGGPEVAILFMLLFGAAACVVIVLVVMSRSAKGRASQGAPATPLSAEVDDSLRRLAKLKEEGVITDQEFETKKRALLGM